MGAGSRGDVPEHPMMALRYRMRLWGGSPERRDGCTDDPLHRRAHRSTTAASTWPRCARAGAGCGALQIFTRHPQVLRRQDLDPSRSGWTASGPRWWRPGSLRRTWWCTPPTCSTPPPPTRPSGPAPRAGSRKELERSTALGVGAVCFHPGAATDGDRDAATARVARAITAALEAVPGNDPAAGGEHGRRRASRSGRTPDEVGASWPRCRARCGPGPATGSTPATCSPPGTTSPRRRRRSAASWTPSRARPASRPAFFHLNDSEGALGSNKDRHVLIGRGEDRARTVPLAATRPRGRAGSAAASWRRRRSTRRSPTTTPRPIPGMWRCSACSASWRRADLCLVLAEGATAESAATRTAGATHPAQLCGSQ